MAPLSPATAFLFLKPQITSFALFNGLSAFCCALSPEAFVCKPVCLFNRFLLFPTQSFFVPVLLQGVWKCDGRVEVVD